MDRGRFMRTFLRKLLSFVVAGWLRLILARANEPESTVDSQSRSHLTQQANRIIVFTSRGEHFCFIFRNDREGRARFVAAVLEQVELGWIDEEDVVPELENSFGVELFK